MLIPATRLFPLAFAITLFSATVVLGQESRWTYEHRVDPLTRHGSDVLSVHGHYVGVLPAKHSEGTPVLSVTCSGENLEALVVATGIMIDHQFGASPKVLTQTDDEKSKTDRAEPALMADSETLRFSGPQNRIGGTDMLFAKKYLVAVEVSGDRIAEMEFEIPSDSSSIRNYCGVRPKQKP